MARALRDGGDRGLAEQVKGLRRPSVAAWLVNALVRAQPDDVDELLETGSALRETQIAVMSGRADGAALQALTGARRTQIDGLLAAVRDLAAEAGRRNAPLDAVDATLVAATADAAAADAVRSGRLVKELSYSGFGMTEDLVDAVAPALRAVSKPKSKPAATEKFPAGESPKPRAAGTATPRGGARPPEPARDPAADKRAAATAAATEAVQAAQGLLQDALGAADDAQRGYDAVVSEAQRAEADEQRLVAELAVARERVTALKERTREARAAAKSAHVDAERSRSGLVKAQQKLDHLR